MGKKKKEYNVVYKGGLGFMGTLTMVLVILKALGLTTISWFWVFLPAFWWLYLMVGIITIFLPIMAIAIVFLFIVSLIEHFTGKDLF